ncbi:MAG: choice-of-anchor E domain-containing protein [Phycisphaeraceae bacterium]|nr:choice-of-anchor E domain-containing protein [Phycisphaeraceae bacterium]MCB9848296.1 choice-of-anchor E domain-containing protein [Phycisphaeraceae bacterium]
MNKTTLIAGAAVLAASGAAQAGMMLQEEMHMAMADLMNTNWMEKLDIPQFDTMGGNRTLEQVMITLDGHVEGAAMAESLDAAPAHITLNLGATISLSLMGDDLAVVIPVAMEAFDATAFDGSLDFMGPSGMSYPDLTADMSDMASLTSGMDDLTPWIGAGNVSLVAEALGASSGTGAGNLFLQFSTLASAKVTVIYKFTEVPTPGSAALLSVAGVFASRRRR